jgi:2-polyprenyl-3-methyl-5-hydroxy-6-metoxy-1,4-benzoquinol methylase
MSELKQQEDVKDYFVRHATRFDGLYGGDNAATRVFDRLFRRPMYDRYVYTIQALAESTGKKYLDLGCGSGRYSVALAQLGAKVTGLDFSAAMLALAENYTAEAGQADKVTYVKTDINEWMQSTSERFDASLAMGVFDYLADPTLTLSLMLKVSENVIVSLPAPTFPRSQLRSLRYKMQNCPVFYFRQADVEKLVTDAGGEITEIKRLGNAGFWIICKKR